MTDTERIAELETTVKALAEALEAQQRADDAEEQNCEFSVCCDLTFRAAELREAALARPDVALVMEESAYWKAKGHQAINADARLAFAGIHDADSTSVGVDSLAADRDRLKAAVKALAAALDLSLLALERGYWSTRSFIDANVPGWVHGDDGPSYAMLKVATELRQVLARHQEGK